MANDYQERFEREIKAIKDLNTNDQRNHWEMGRRYNLIVDGRLMEQVGDKQAREYMKAQLPELSPATLKRYGAIARHFKQDDAAKYGTTRLCALLTYLTLRGIHPESTPLDKMTVMLPQEGGEAPKPFAECTVAELNAAIRARKHEPEHYSERDAAQIKKYQEGLSGKLGERMTLKTHAHHGSPLIDLTNVPLDQLAELGQLLMEIADEIQKEQTAALEAKATAVLANLEASRAQARGEQPQATVASAA
jgi:hypothetical protein